MRIAGDPYSANQSNELLDRIALLESQLVEARSHIARIEAVAHVDLLTGALNLRGFAHEIERALAFGLRYDTPVSIALLDVDGLTSINERHGRGAGDAVLRTMAKKLKANVRASDIIARIGSDEFGILLWHAAEPAALAKAEQLQALLDATNAVKEGPRVPLFASIGVAELGGGNGTDAALALANQRLRDNKRTRRAPRRAA